jgi:glycosyltransferase involved in cell wall biosynthesis
MSRSLDFSMWAPDHQEPANRKPGGGHGMKVVLISPCMGSYGGMESFVLTVAAGVAKLPGFTVQVVFKEAGAFSLQENLRQKIWEAGVDVMFCRRSSFKLWQSVSRADLVHLQNPCPDVALMARLAGKPLLINVINHAQGGSGLHRRLWNACLHLAHRRFYISDFVRRTWERTEKPWPNSRVVFPICELAPLDPLPVGERSGFVFLARWIENKGLDTLVEAYARSGLNLELWPLRLLGDGPLRPRILARLRELGLDGRVDAPGFLSETDKAERIRRSRFAVIPPNTGEDFGLVALEARHLGLPCLITRDGGVPEAAGKHCLACEPGDVDDLARLLQQAASMSEEDYHCLAAAAHESLETELVRPSFYANVYREMLTGGKNNRDLQ